MRLVQVTVWFLLIGWLYFLRKGTESEFTAAIYYLWDKAKDVLLIACIYGMIAVKYRWILQPVLIYSIIRFIWEIISILTGWDINHPPTVKLLLTIILTGLTILLIKDLIQRKRQ